MNRYNNWENLCWNKNKVGKYYVKLSLWKCILSTDIKDDISGSLSQLISIQASMATSTVVLADCWLILYRNTINVRKSYIHKPSAAPQRWDACQGPHLPVVVWCWCRRCLLTHAEVLFDICNKSVKDWTKISIQLILQFGWAVSFMMLKFNILVTFQRRTHSLCRY